jgi:hypothetical protein
MEPGLRVSCVRVVKEDNKYNVFILKKGINVIDVELIDENGKLKHQTSVQFSALHP